MEIRAPIQRAIIEEVWIAALKANNEETVEAAMKAFRSARYQETGGAGPGVLVGTSDKGHSVTFGSPTFRSVHPDELLALAQIAVELTRSIVASFPAYTQTEVFNALLGKFISRRSIQADFSSMNVH